MLLHQYETIGTLESSFAEYEPLDVVDKDGVFLPDHEDKVVELLQQAGKDNKSLAREVIASRGLIAWLIRAYKDLAAQKARDQDVVTLGKRLHGMMADMMWDCLTLCGQVDLAMAIPEVQPCSKAGCAYFTPVAAGHGALTLRFHNEAAQHPPCCCPCRGWRVDWCQAG